MHPRLRVPFGLRSDATESEGSWSGSQCSSLPTDSDVDSLKGFDCDGDLPGLDVEPPTSPPFPERAASLPVKESWSEIDERARALEAQKPRTISPVNVHQSNCSRSDSTPLSRAERSDCWRSKTFQRRRPERKRPDRRRPRVDPPLKGAVVRPYTLPSGPITILRRPQIQESEDCAKPPGSSEPKRPGLVGDSKLHQDAKENDQGNGMMIGSNAKVVNTRFGEGFVVNNPPVSKTESLPENGTSKSKEVRVAHNAATMAMAGLSMKSKEDKYPSYEASVSAETYDRTLGGRYRQKSGRCKDRWVGSSYNDRFPRNKRPNVFIGRRPKSDIRRDALLGE